MYGMVNRHKTEIRFSVSVTQMTKSHFKQKVLGHYGTCHFVLTKVTPVTKKKKKKCTEM